jgi:5S rRNA maturation endonuclease (ribonuclease M5)
MTENITDNIQNRIRELMPEMLNALDIKDYVIEHGIAQMPCPIHGGDNPIACTIFFGEKAYIINWKCYTNECESEYGKSLIHFIQGVLSVKGNKKASYANAMDWCKGFLGYKPNQTFIDSCDKEQNTMIGNTKLLGIERELSDTQDDILEYLDKVVCPSPYFLDRGYDSAILTMNHVGDWIGNGSMENRAVVPILNDTGDYIAGYTSRSKDKTGPKWKHSKGIRTDSYLYNYSNAIDQINATNTIIITEGTADAWRVAESGYTNVVSIFGAFLSDRQHLLMERTMAMNLIIFLDNDKAGQKAAKTIEERYEMLYNIYNIVPEIDPGTDSVEQIQYKLNECLKDITIY